MPLDPTADNSRFRRLAGLGLPLLLCASLAGATGVCWRSLVEREREQAARALDTASASIDAEFEAQMDGRALALARMARRWAVAGTPERAAWADDARQYVHDFSDLAAVSYVDPSMRVRWIEPVEEGASVVGVDLSNDPRRAPVFAAAREARTPFITPPVTLLLGGRGFAIVAPISGAGGFGGYITGAYRVKPMFDTILPEKVTRGYSVVVRAAGEEVYRGQTPAAERAPSRVETNDKYGIRWELDVAPGPEVAAANASRIPEAVLLFGLLSAVFSGVASAFALEARRNVAERRGAERELRGSLRDLADVKYALDESAIVAVADAEGRVVYANDKFCEISKYSREELTGVGRRIVEPSDRSEEFARVLWATISRGRVWRGEVRERAKDGSHYWVETTIVPFADEGGKPAQYIAIRHDITQRKAAELALSRRSRIATLNAEIGVALQPDASLGDGLQACVDALARGLDTAVARIWTADHEDGALELRASAGARGGPAGARVRLDDTTKKIALVACGGLPYVTDHLRDDPYLDREWADAEGLVAFAACPLVVDHRLIGVVEIYDLRPFSDVTLQTFSVMSDRIAVGIEHKRVEAQIKRSLVEKEALLKEIHHRVKNNLQIVSSLLSLQSAYVDDERALAVFAESQLRVQSMALVHEHLYRSDDLSRVNFAEYVRELGASLVSSSIADLRTIDLEVEVDELYLGIHKAVPCGLIVNELVSNAIKHAFPDGRRGTVRVGFREVGDRVFRLSVRDDGVGLPGGVVPERSTSMGLRLVTILVDQIGGTLEVRSEGGTEFDVTFASPASGRQDAVEARGEEAAPSFV